jgi:nitroreductase
MKPSIRLYSALSTAFDEIVRNRKSVRVFNKTMNIDRRKVQKLLELSSYSPSSLNMQPFRVIVVSSTSGRYDIADTAMMGGNSQRVRDAPYTIIFLADKGEILSTFK